MATSKRYDKIERSKLWDYIKLGYELYAVDMRTLKVLNIAELTINQVNFYYGNADTFFIHAYEVNVSA